MENSTYRGALCSIRLTKHFSGDKIKMTGMIEARSTGGGEERCIQGLVGKPEGRRVLERPKRRWEDNIKIYHREVRWRALVNAVINIRVP